MRLLTSIGILFLILAGIFSLRNYDGIAQNRSSQKQVTTQYSPEFEKAVEIIKKYEGLHQPRHWPLVGYGHMVLPGEKYSRNRRLSEQEADALLRKDLLKNCAVFRSFGPDSLILGVLAYNIGSGATLRSSVAKKLKAGDRDIYQNYIAHSKYKGKTLSQLKKRRIEEFETLFLKESITENNHNLHEQNLITATT